MRKLPSALLISIILICILSIGGIFLYSYVNSKKVHDSLILNNVDPKTVNQIQGTIVYSGSKSGLIDYYSPSLNVTLKYDKSKYDLFEQTDRVTLSSKFGHGMNDLFGVLKLETKDNTDNDLLTYYKKYGNDVKLVSSKESDGVKWIVISYTAPFVTTVNSEVINTVISRKIGDSFFNFYVRGIDANELSNPAISDLKNLILSINTNVDKVDSNVTVLTENGKVEISFAKKDWDVIYQSNNGLSIDSRKSLKTSQARLRISTIQVYISPTKEYLLKDLTNSTSFLSTYTGYKSFRLLGNLEKTFGDTLFYGKRYEYVYGDWDDNLKHIVEKYIGFNDKNGIQISIEIEYTKNQEALYPDILKVVEGIKFNEKAKVLGSKSSNSGTTEIKKSVILGKPSVGHIFVRECQNAKFSTVTGLETLSNKTYSVCDAWFGSGFWINKDGYMITNAHVASANSIDNFIMGTYYAYKAGLYNHPSANNWVLDLLKAIDPIYLAKGIDILKLSDDDLIDLVLTNMLQLQKSGYVSISKGEKNIYIQNGKEFKVDPLSYKVLNALDHIEADLVDHNELESQTLASINKTTLTYANSDLALIKAKTRNTQYVSAKLADPESIAVGNSIYVIGFPGVADNKSIFSSGAEAIPTVTAGTISAVKPSISNSYDLVQIDASVERGNSGGPILSSDGEVIGVATYGISTGQTSGDYNAGISVQEVVKMLAKNNIKNDTGEIYNLMNGGINDMNKSYYKRAAEKFEKAILINLSTKPTLLPLIKISNDKIAGGEDKTPWITMGYIDVDNTYLVLGVVLGVILLSTIVLLVVVLRSKRKEQEQKSDQPVTPTPTITTNATSSLN